MAAKMPPMLITVYHDVIRASHRVGSEFKEPWKRRQTIITLTVCEFGALYV